MYRAMSICACKSIPMTMSTFSLKCLIQFLSAIMCIFCCLLLYDIDYDSLNGEKICLKRNEGRKTDRQIDKENERQIV